MAVCTASPAMLPRLPGIPKTWLGGHRLTAGIESLPSDLGVSCPLRNLQLQGRNVLREYIQSKGYLNTLSTTKVLRFSFSSWINKP
jgi:hypothetical protein